MNADKLEIGKLAEVNVAKFVIHNRFNIGKSTLNIITPAKR